MSPKVERQLIRDFKNTFIAHIPGHLKSGIQCTLGAGQYKLNTFNAHAVSLHRHTSKNIYSRLDLISYRLVFIVILS